MIHDCHWMHSLDPYLPQSFKSQRQPETVDGKHSWVIATEPKLSLCKALKHEGGGALCGGLSNVTYLQ
jgi:hypothetical protein